jgi:DNA gyrase subunit A
MSNINEVNLTETLENSFAQYAGMVIQDRAIVDVRDCMKPSARQLMWAQYIEKLTYNKPFKKATKSVAAGMSHTYVHGDASAYSTLIRMGKPFAVRYPLEAVQGSYGNQIENDNEAASRYVEMKLSELGTHLFDSIEKNTIDKQDWRENYDGTEEYPAVLPSIGFYNLVQGSTGIGIALSSSIPQFNLKEINNSLIKLLWNPQTDFDEIYCAPDFATGATIINGSEIKESIKNGTGPSIKIRAKIDIDYENNQLLVTEMPYGVYTNTVCTQLAEAIEKNPNCGIAKFLDLTGVKPLIKITLEKNASFGKVKDFLYKNTSLQSYFSVNMTMLKDGKFPQVFGLKEALLEYLEHSKKVLRNRITFDLQKAQDRLEIVEGYLKALSIIDEVVALIKSKSSSASACIALMETYDFSERQAKAILDLKLVRLVNMEIAKIEQEKSDLLSEINQYNELLTDNNKFLKEIEKSLVEVANKYGDDRRTIVTNLDEEAPIIEEKHIISYVSKNGAIISKEVGDLALQKRGRIGEKIKFSNKSDYIWKTLVGKTTDKVVLFTNKGKSYLFELSELLNPQEIYINQVVDLEQDETVTNILPIEEANKCKYVIFATKNGIVKKTKMKEYLSSRKKAGLIAVKIREDDELVNTQLIKNEDDKILLVTKKGYAILVNQNDFSDTGRATLGVKGINLGTGDSLVSMQVVDNETSKVVVVTSKGYGKLIDINEFSLCNRATKGSLLYKFKEDDDYIVGALALTNKDKQLIVNSRLSSLKIEINTISEQSRMATGVQIINASGINNSVKYLNLVN